MTKYEAMCYLHNPEDNDCCSEKEVQAYKMAIKALGQKLLVIEYNGTEHRIECESFEFRTNQVTNWVRIKHSDGSTEVIHDICVVKAESEG